MDQLQALLGSDSTTCIPLATSQASYSYHGHRPSCRGRSMLARLHSTESSVAQHGGNRWWRQDGVPVPRSCYQGSSNSQGAHGARNSRV